MVSNSNDNHDDEMGAVDRRSTEKGCFIFSVKFQVAFLMLGLGIGAVIVGISVLAANKNDDNTVDLTPTPGPTAAPTAKSVPTVPTTPASADLFELIADALGNDDVNESGTTANLAAQWMLSQDPAGLTDVVDTVDEENFLQRYLLVNFYFSTTLDGTTEWNSCGPPPAEDPEEEDCVFLRPVVGGGTNRIPWVRWLSAAHECDWAGITCATIGGSLRVTEIELAGQGLGGTLVTEILALPNLSIFSVPQNEFTGEISPMFGSAGMLETLDLSSNQLTGGITQDFLEQPMTTLRLFENELTDKLPEFPFTTTLSEFSIGNNQFTGTIPDSISFASELTTLDISYNNLDGTMPAVILGELFLKEFYANNNNFQGPLPLSVANNVWFSTLETLVLNSNQFTGSIPTLIGDLPLLEDLRLSDNDLAGEIPETLYSLTGLFRLELADNMLTGTISPQFGQLTSLERLEIQFNGFTGSVPFCSGDTEIVIEADCLPADNPPVDCSCCTTCCNPETLECSD